MVILQYDSSTFWPVFWATEFYTQLPNFIQAALLKEFKVFTESKSKKRKVAVKEEKGELKGNRKKK